MNSHRFLVHAEGIAASDEDLDQVIGGDGLTPGVPWWLVLFIGGSVLVALMLFLPGKKKQKKDTEKDAS